MVTMALRAAAVLAAMVPLRFTLGFAPRKTKEVTSLMPLPPPTKGSLAALDTDLQVEEAAHLVAHLEERDLGDLAKSRHVLLAALT